MGRYLMTHSLLASWLYTMKENPYEDMTTERDPMGEFMQTLRREPTLTTEAMQNGIKFEDMVTDIINGRAAPDDPWYGAAEKVARRCAGGILQYKAKKTIEVGGMSLLLYGRLDCLKAGEIIDIKFTKNYDAGKFFSSTQHPTYYSKTGSKPLANITRATARTNSKNKGSKWGQYDFASWCAVWLLYLVEFADWNSQSVIGIGICGSSSMANTGGTDSMNYHTGTAASSRTTAGAVQYRNIENPWGNIWEWIDGVNFSDGTVYVCTTPANYADDTTSGYTNAGTKTQSDGWIKAIGISSTAPWAFFPTEVGGSETTYIPDYAYYYSGWRVLAVGGSCSSTTGYVGLFRFGAYNASSGSDSGVGARLLFHP